MRLQYFTLLWKYAEMVMVPKPNKPENVINSSILCCLSKIIEKLFLRRLQKILDNKKVIPEYQ